MDVKNYEQRTTGLDRRTFIRGIGVSAAAIAAGRLMETPAPGIVLASHELPMPPLAPPAPETHDVRAELEQAWNEIISERSGRIDAALFDSTAGLVNQASSNNAGRFKTASIIKLAILEKLLTDQPDYARQHIDYIRPMITLSDNGVAQDLWSRVGGNSEMQRFFDSIGASETKAGGDDGGLFSTLTTAADQLMVVNNIAYATHMRPEDATLARELLHQVVPGQRWGISAGVPSDVMVELKDGWVDERRHSIGHVNGQGVDYTIAVLTDDGPGAGYDTETIELLSAKAWQILRGV